MSLSNFLRPKNEVKQFGNHFSIFTGGGFGEILSSDTSATPLHRAAGRWAVTASRQRAVDPAQLRRNSGRSKHFS